MKIHSRIMHRRGRIAIVGNVTQPHDEVLNLVREGLTLVDSPTHVEVHIKGAGFTGPQMSGSAYRGPAGNVLGSARYLITMRIPNECGPFPVFDRCYPGKNESTAKWPRYDFHSWQECLVHLAAHEGAHTRQTDEGRSHSEMDAERRATAVLRKWRAATYTGQQRPEPKKLEEH